MATTILRSNANPSIFQTRCPNRSRRRTRSTGDRGRFQTRDRSAVARVPAGDIVMGQVKILKRGEPLTAFIGSRGSEIAGQSRDVDLGLGSTNRLGPDPETVQSQVRLSDPPLVYAGSGVFVKSPPPSSVPVPCFLGKVGTELRVAAAAEAPAFVKCKFRVREMDHQRGLLSDIGSC